MRPTHAALLSVAILLIQVAGPAACSKKKTDQTDQPAAAASEPARPRIDPRLAPDPAAGMASGTGEARAGDAVDPSPHRAAPPVPATGGGRTPEKTDSGRVVIGPMTGAVPESWKVRPTTSGMRVAEWTIPGPDGDAELVVYHFGAGGAGSVEANLDRWVGQFEEPA